MIRQILFPFDFSAQGAQAVPFVRALASQLHATVTVLSVVPLDLVVLPANMEREVEGWRKALQARLDQSLTTELSGLTVKRITEAGDPGVCITDAAHREGVDLIMMPTHGVGLFRRLLMGSAASKVLHDARCPVWTAAHAEEQPAGGLPKTILCAVDGGPATGALLTWAGDFSTRAGASLTVTHVVGPMPTWAPLEMALALQEQAREDAQKQIASLQAAAGVQAPLRVFSGDIVVTVIEHARELNADLVIIGRGALQSPLGRLRTNAYNIIQRSPCPVLSV